MEDLKVILAKFSEEFAVDIFEMFSEGILGKRIGEIFKVTAKKKLEKYREFFGEYSYETLKKSLASTSE